MLASRGLRSEARGQVPDEVRVLVKEGNDDGENSETDTWLDYARDCGCMKIEKHAELTKSCVEVGKMPGSMLNNLVPFLLKSDR